MSDALEQAKDLFLDASTRRGLNHLPIGDVTELTQAAALIALAERMDCKPHFIQIGGRSFCPDQIIGVTDFQDCVHVHMRHEVGFTFLEEDGKRAVFLKWWNKYADIEVVQ